MKKLLTILIAAMFAATSFGAIAQDAPKGEKKAKVEKKAKGKKAAKKAAEKPAEKPAEAKK